MCLVAFFHDIFEQTD